MAPAAEAVPLHDAVRDGRVGQPLSPVLPHGLALRLVEDQQRHEDEEPAQHYCCHDALARVIVPVEGVELALAQHLVADERRRRRGSREPVPVDLRRRRRWLETEVSLLLLLLVMVLVLVWLSSCSWNVLSGCFVAVVLVLSATTAAAGGGFGLFGRSR